MESSNSNIMNQLFRLTPVAALVALTLTSCGTVNKGLDSAMGIFKPRGEKSGAADEVATSVTHPGVNHNAAVMYIDINGARRKVVIELKPAIAPKTVANFKKLVNSGFYNGQAIHRAFANYLVQMGDPNTKEDGKKSEWGLGDVGYKLQPEISAPLQKGSLAMARSNAAIAAGDKQSSGSQFFILLRSASKLDGEYTVFGKVTEGLEVLNAISGMTVDTNDAPTRRFEIKSIRLLPNDSPELQPDRTSNRKTRATYEKGAFEKFFERFW